MAGSPDAGKTEFSECFLERLTWDEPNAQIICINPDAIRESLPGYIGGKAHIFQKAVSIAVSNLIKSVSKNKQPFLLDGMLSNFEKAKENIERCLKRNREVYIFYIYQDPETAWRFAQKREAKEGRRIELDTFCSQYFTSKKTVNKLKEHFGDKIKVALVVKDAKHKVLQYEQNIRIINDFVIFKYINIEELKRALALL